MVEVYRHVQVDYESTNDDQTLPERFAATKFPIE